VRSPVIVLLCNMVYYFEQFVYCILFFIIAVLGSFIHLIWLLPLSPFIIIGIIWKAIGPNSFSRVFNCRAQLQDTLAGSPYFFMFGLVVIVLTLAWFPICLALHLLLPCVFPALYNSISNKEDRSYLLTEFARPVNRFYNRMNLIVDIRH
jgi:hypothetical protein